MVVEFGNLTPFDALAFKGYDIQDREYHIVAMAVGYRLQKQDNGHWIAQIMDDDPISLCLGDEHFGDPSKSSLSRESDMIPYKPSCDVLVTGSAYAPAEKEIKHWDVKLSLKKGTHAEESILTKQLRVSGLSIFRRVASKKYKRTAIAPTNKVALRYENAWGGASRVDTPGEEQTPESLPLLNEVCFSNPVGGGWIEKRWFKALADAKLPEPEFLPAPQIDHADGSQLEKPIVATHPGGELDAQTMAEVAGSYGYTPAGFGPLCKAWAPRLALAGTYDQKWLDERHPMLPKDFDFAFWNGAPLDQQIKFPDLTEHYQLVTENLTPGGGQMRVAIPPHRALVLADLGGVHLPFPMQVDTLILDTDQMRLITIWRAGILESLEPERLEARFITDPNAPWIPWKPLESDEDSAAEEGESV